MAVVRPTLHCADAATWESWLETNHATSDGVRLAIAKKGGDRSSVSYAEALDIALCFGWIDGQKWSVDEHHALHGFWLQGFGPRRPRSMWSQVNRDKVAALITAKRMRPPGLAEIERAQADGRWAAAYAAQSSTELPDDLGAAIAASPAASAFFPTLTKQNRFAIIFRTTTVKRAETRARKIAQYVAMLERGETIYPQH
jgi:uncharacterized protein YdeI (YjbR/CyaY-like superfamily)